MGGWVGVETYFTPNTKNGYFVLRRKPGGSGPHLLSQVTKELLYIHSRTDTAFAGRNSLLRECLAWEGCKVGNSAIRNLELGRLGSSVS